MDDQRDQSDHVPHARRRTGGPSARAFATRVVGARAPPPRDLNRMCLLAVVLGLVLVFPVEEGEYFVDLKVFLLALVLLVRLRKVMAAQHWRPLDYVARRSGDSW